MKKVLFVFTTLLFFACNDAGDTASESTVKYRDVDSDNLKGDISMIELSPYAIDSTMTMGDMDSCCTSVTEYNADGNTVKNYTKDSKGTKKSETMYTRHPNGLPENINSTGENGKSTGSFHIKLDEDGKIILAQAIDSNGNADVYYTDITTNEVGEVTGWKQYDKDSVYRQMGASVYDGHKFISFTLTDSVGTVKNTGSSKYNDMGEEIESTNINVGKDTTVTKYTYPEHDEQGNWTKRITYNKDGKPTKVHIRTITYRTKPE